MSDSREDIERDIAAVSRISAVPAMLRVICQNTGMGFAVVARVTDGDWTACVVQDDIEFGLEAGGQLDVSTTLCSESRALRQPVFIDQASTDPLFCQHHTPRIYNIESYISVPIIRPNGEYFGNLCAIDRRPKQVSDTRTVTMFKVFAELIALQLDSDDRHSATQAALDSERATAELREQFIAVLGHDLRNPLSSIAALSQLLLSGEPDPRVRRLSERIVGSTRRMARMIDDTLDFARGRLGSGMSLKLDLMLDFDAALRDVVAELRAAHPARTVLDDIVVRDLVRGDRGRLQQLLSNLLGNALTYGAADRPVQVTASSEDKWLTLTVHNHGEPIAPDSAARIFEPYWRPESSTPGGGLGLGLYICDQITRAHGGELRVASSAEGGTTFTARLPIGVPLAPPGA